MAAMLRGLVADIADELIAALPAMLGAKAEQRATACIGGCAAGLLEREGLVALLLRRADEQQLSGQAERERRDRRRTGRRRRRAGRRSGDGADAGAGPPPGPVRPARRGIR